jgi:hypothetical protein
MEPHAEPQLVTEECSGKWIAWNEEGTKIIASGENPRKVRQEAIAVGETDPILETVPPSDSFFVGGS